MNLDHSHDTLPSFVLPGSETLLIFRFNFDFVLEDSNKKECLRVVSPSSSSEELLSPEKENEGGDGGSPPPSLILDKLICGTFAGDFDLVRYFDENWIEKEERYTGMKARVIQHEYDHIEGKLFVDYLSSIKRKLIKNKLSEISKGNCEVSYKVKSL